MKSGDWIILGILGSISLVGAFFDVRSKTVPRWLLTVGGSAVTIAVALCLFQGSDGSTILPTGIPLLLRLTGIVPGVVLLVLSLLKKGMGVGDSVLILFYGWGLGVRLLFFLMLLWYLGVFMVGLFCLTILRKGRKYALPFYPFAALGTGVLTVCLLL